MNKLAILEVDALVGHFDLAQLFTESQGQERGASIDLNSVSLHCCCQCHRTVRLPLLAFLPSLGAMLAHPISSDAASANLINPVYFHEALSK